MFSMLDYSLGKAASGIAGEEHKQSYFSPLNTIEEALADLQVGRLVILFNEKSRTQGVYLVCGAQFVTPERAGCVTALARSSLLSAPLSLAMEQSRIDELHLPKKKAEDIGANVCDRDKRERPIAVGLNASTGHVPARTLADKQAQIVQACLNPRTKTENLQQPGDILLVGAHIGGVLSHASEAEAVVDLARLAGLHRAGLFCEIKTSAKNAEARKKFALAYAKRHHLKAISITDLVTYRLKNETVVTCEAVAKLPTEFGDFKVRAYVNSSDRSEHLAITKGKLLSNEPIAVYFHAECLTGDAFGSLSCSCHNRLSTAMRTVEAIGRGIIIYLRPANRDLNVVSQLKRSASQSANLAPNLKSAHGSQSLYSMPKNLSLAAKMLKDIGIDDLVLIAESLSLEVFKSNQSQLKKFGLNAVDYISLPTQTNISTIHFSADKNQALTEYSTTPQSLKKKVQQSA